MLDSHKDLSSNRVVSHRPRSVCPGEIRQFHGLLGLVKLFKTIAFLAIAGTRSPGTSFLVNRKGVHVRE